MDDLQLNFATPDDSAQFNGSVPINARVIVKGSWKKRRIVTKIVKSKVQRATQPETNESLRSNPPNRNNFAEKNSPAESLTLENAKMKRNREPRREVVANNRISKSTTTTRAPGNVISNSNNGSNNRTTFVTSLFTGNPEIPKPTPYSSDNAELPKQSSNAIPEIVTDTTTFKGLGLNANLIRHLETKMSVKVPTLIQQATLAALQPKNGEILCKDVLMQAQTGSGKTLAFLLPIVDSLVKAQFLLSEDGKKSLSRNLGTIAIVLAPTRELAKQIYAVLEDLLKYSSSKSNGETDSSLLHWIVAGLVVGGDKKKSEKARLRKGCNILVSTPGRLLDHFKTTQAFEAGNLRWLVLDEADRFLELGFEESLRELLAIIDKKRDVCEKAEKRLNVPIWPVQKQIFLTSATIKNNVASLAETTLKNPVYIKAAEESVSNVLDFEMAKKASKGKDFIRKKDTNGEESDDDFWESYSKKIGLDASLGHESSEFSNRNQALEEDVFTVPEQLKQTYAIVPAKLRLVTLLAVLRQMNEQAKSSNGHFKAIIFTDTCDSVDFLHHILANAHKGPGRDEELPKKGHPTISKAEKKSFEEKQKARNAQSQTNSPLNDNSTDNKQLDEDPDDLLAPLSDSQLTISGLETPFLPNAKIFKLHGNCSQTVRAIAYKGFKSETNAVIICTDVAARGLDLPDITSVIQYDLPSNANDYVHRVGRTARLGRDGHAVSLILPSEATYVDLLHKRGVAVLPEDGISILKHLVGVSVTNGRDTPHSQSVDKKQKKKTVEDWATDVQMIFERFVLSCEQNLELARSAFRSHIRAYATHVSEEKQLFNIKNLHLGHVAKSFALRDAPGLSMGLAKASIEKNKVGKAMGKPSPNLKRKAFMLQSSSGVASEFGDGNVRTLVGGLPKKKIRTY
ncbi:ATP-dependent RNA helicase dbp7 [Entophlyctis luteolus]|nr:ATP-dependent RNA helicase dbp7 [Entophlyctis luteolus]KAJ3394423.1 ATP-dependent RNA helicase dbp7 [Entophlyctis sp. JEL0112]